MSKKFLSLALALALCLGLTVPAFAKDLKDATEQDILNTFTIYRNGSIDEKKGDYSVDTPVKLGYFGDETAEAHSYSVISKNDSWTVTNTGSKEISASGDTVYDIFAQLTIYTLESSADDWYTTLQNDYYWGDKNHFIHSMYEQDETLTGYTVRLKAGESTTIPVSAFMTARSDNDFGSGFFGPDSDPDDCIYELKIYANYQGMIDNWDYYQGYYDNMSYSYSFYFRVDEARKAQIDAAGLTPATPAATFADVPANAYYANAVAYAVDKNITNGTNDGANGQPKTFSPDKTCTHAEILTFLYRADRGGGAATADDMTKAVSWAQEKGMIDGAYNGNNPCTRADTMRYIWQAFGKESAASSNFTDVPASADYAAAVSWAVANGITNGTNDGTNGQPKTFSPGDTCTRGQIVTFLLRAYVPAERLTV